MLDQATKNYFEGKLKEEKKSLEEELGLIARVNPKNPSDWEARPPETSEPDFNDETADRLEELEEREAESVPLEKRLQNVNLALQRIFKGSYGECEICHQPIERERLEINPAASTCKSHLNQTN